MFSTPGFCFVGIDGGATRTIVRVEDGRGETLIQQAAREIERLGAALAAQSVNKALPCSLMGGLASFIEPWLGESLRSRSCAASRIQSAARCL